MCDEDTDTTNTGRERSNFIHNNKFTRLVNLSNTSLSHIMTKKVILYIQGDLGELIKTCSVYKERAILSALSSYLLEFFPQNFPN